MNNSFRLILCFLSEINESNNIQIKNFLSLTSVSFVLFKKRIVFICQNIFSVMKIRQKKKEEISYQKVTRKKERRPRCKSRTHRRRGFILESISRHRRMSHGGIVRPDEEIQHKSFPAVSLSVCLRAYACVARVWFRNNNNEHLTLERLRRLAS